MPTAGRGTGPLAAALSPGYVKMLAVIILNVGAVVGIATVSKLLSKKRHGCAVAKSPPIHGTAPAEERAKLKAHPLCSGVAPDAAESTKLCVAKMLLHGAKPLQALAYARNHTLVVNGERGTIREAAIRPPANLPRLDDLKRTITPNPALLQRTVVLKLNGGLGTVMGMERAKSLMIVHDRETFLDIMAEQVLHLRRAHGPGLRFMFMNSFNTSEDTMHYLATRHPALFPDGVDKTAYFRDQMEIMQSTVPKILRDSYEPAYNGDAREYEWHPPGHGELWNALEHTGQLDKLLREGYEYMFVSNGDNLGATVDLQLLTLMARDGLDFMLECAERTQMDVKGSHLAQYIASGRLLVRDIAQTVESEIGEFYDIHKHNVFNTNSLWVNLRALKDKMRANGGIMPLPVVRNAKRLVPTDPDTAHVLQLEGSVASAIELFDKAGAVVVPRSRFSPVKMCSDLLAVRSDCYYVTPDKSLSLIPSRQEPPQIRLDDDHYKYVHMLEQMFGGAANMVPSLAACTALSIEGPVVFGPGVVIEGDCQIVNKSAKRKTVPPGRHTGVVVL